MSWREDPATEKQLNYLKEFGFNPERVLTKGEASDLIAQFSEDPERSAIRDKNQSEKWEEEFNEREQNLAFHLHSEFDEAKQSMDTAESDEIDDAKMYLEDARNERMWFWQDTFRSPDQMEGAGTNEQQIKLYFVQGYRFEMPAEEVIQSLLVALDANSPTWDKDTPEYFFQTVEHNFPELLRKHIDAGTLEVLGAIYSKPDESS
jgi:hypothetical protein